MQEHRFAEYYRSLSDSELLEIADDWHSLIEDAKSCLQSEVARRGLAFDPTVSKDRDEVEVQYRDLVTIRRYRDLSEAIVARAVVESAGIFCFLKDENLVRLDWQMSNLIGGIRLQVAAADVEAAEAVLEQPVPETITLPDLSSYDQPHCPKCNSVDISWERQGRKAALLSLYLFSLPSPRGSESWHCNSCGLRWVEEESAQDERQD
jgi:hypothetical protein